MQKIIFCDRQQQNYLLNTWRGDTVYEVLLAVKFEIDFLAVTGKIENELRFGLYILEVSRMLLADTCTV